MTSITQRAPSAPASITETKPRRVARQPRKYSRVWREARDFLFVLPAVVLLAAVVIVPAGVGIYRSFFDWFPGLRSDFVGFANYTELARSTRVHQILRNEGFFLLGVPLWSLLPVVVALLLHERVAFPGVFRTIFYFPAVLSPAIVAILFRAILRPDGLFNQFLTDAGLGSLTQNWVNDPVLVKPVLIVLLAWASMGGGVIIFSAALSAIPPELFEAAEIDGASWWQRFRFIMVPTIRPLLEFWVVLQVITVFTGIFGWIFVLTRGGPGFSTTTLDYDVYNNALQYGRFGLAAAEAVYLLGIVALLVLVAARLRATQLGRQA